ncbi:MAG: ribonuclease HI [Candidatus Peregrinibacteria bacterium Greene1014_49]|nr:MAG: ribonuclease HI [Candidatus Peregrinibacteria bacterium Greene1014_49]
MIRLPAAIERQLQQMFPRARERDQFVAEVLSRALEHRPKIDEGSPQAVGGTLHLFTDGGCRGNPGQAAIGCVLLDPVSGTVVREHYERIGIGTNNIAEYRALIEGLKIARLYHPNGLVCHLDSELIVKQLSGEYQVRMVTLQPLFQEIRELSKEFRSISFKHVPREDNHHADQLVNKALDEHPSPHYEKP